MGKHKSRGTFYGHSPGGRKTLSSGARSNRGRHPWAVPRQPPGNAPCLDEPVHPGDAAIHPADFAAIGLLAGVAAVLLVALTGWGRLVRSLLRDADDDAPPWAVDAWAGWAAVTVLLQLWHLLLPIDGWTALAVGLAGIAGRLGLRRRRPAGAGRGRTAAGVAILAVAFAAIVRHMRSDLFVYDAGMYYYQAVRWLNEHPIVPGLGNLNLQLGINQTYFPWAALLNLPPLGRCGFMVVNGLMGVVALAPGVTEVLRLRRGGGPPEPVAILRILSLPILVLFAMNEGTANPSPDVFSWVLSVVVFERAAAWLAAARRTGAPPPPPPLLPVLLCAVLATVKLSTAAYGALLVLGMSAEFVRRAGASPRRRLLRPAAAVIGITGAALLPWAGRNIVYTGYPLFPSTVAAIPVDWKIPPFKMMFAAEGIRAWGRHPGPEDAELRNRIALEMRRVHEWDPAVIAPGDFRDLVRTTPWFAAWAEWTLRSGFLTAAVAGAIVFPIAWALLRRRFRGAGDRARALDALYIPLLGALAFWLHAAPALRFGLPFLLLLAALSAAQICTGLPAAVQRAVAALALALAIAAGADGFPPRSKGWAVVTIPHPPVAEMRPFTTRSGLVVSVPVHDVRSFDAPLPATHIRNPRLSLRDPDRGVAGGFKDDAPPPAGRL